MENRRIVADTLNGRGESMAELEKLLVRIGTARDAISRKEEQTSLDYMIDGVLMNCSVMLKEQQETIEGLGVLQKVMETVEPVPDYNVRYWRCPKCNWLLTAMIDDQCSIPSRRDNYCSSCGRPLKWQ